MLRASLSTSPFHAQCLPVDKSWFEFIESGFVEAISMLLLEDTQYTPTHVSWDTSLPAKSWKCPRISEDFARAIDARSNRTSVAANAAPAKWEERTVANSFSFSVYMSMAACRAF
jgi:hypothetical protein